MLWYRMPGVNLENASFHMIVNNNDAMLMADLVSGYGEIDLFVEHPIDAIYLVLFFFFSFFFPSIFIIVLCCSFDYLVFAVCRGVRVVQVVDLPLLNQIRQVHHLPLVK